jgi:hypothetical protein
MRTSERMRAPGGTVTRLLLLLLFTAFTNAWRETRSRRQ